MTDAYFGMCSRLCYIRRLVLLRVCDGYATACLWSKSQLDYLSRRNFTVSGLLRDDKGTRNNFFLDDDMS